MFVRCSRGPASAPRTPFVLVIDPPSSRPRNGKFQRNSSILGVWRRFILSVSPHMDPEILRSSSSIIIPPVSAGAMLLQQGHGNHQFISRGDSSPPDEVVVDVTKPFLPSPNHPPSLLRDGSKVDLKCSGSSGVETFIPSSGRCMIQANRPTDTFLLTHFGFKVLQCLGAAYKWITRFLALGCYSMLIMPGFVQVAFYYYFSHDVRRDIVYGDKSRNKLDLYIPKNKDGLKPVVAFVTGGAWIIGYKAWGSLLGQQLSDNGILVACIDYRNYPKGTISAMVEDASNGIAFICKNISEYGGDPNRIYLMGQSAGAHIASCALVQQAIKEAGEGDDITWSVSQIKSYFGLSGGYNLFNLMEHFSNRGLCRSLFLRIMEGEDSLKRFSPEVALQDPNIKNAVALLPPFVLFHGTGDYSIPSESSKSFANTLKRLGGKAEAIFYEGKSHTDIFVQDPMRGGVDEIYVDLVTTIHSDGSDEMGSSANVVVPCRRRLVPELMLKMASYVSPF